MGFPLVTKVTRGKPNNLSMKVLLVGINAKYIHSNLAIRYLQQYVDGSNHHIEIEEYTINQQVDQILSDIAKHEPDVLGFSCYIWNIEFIKKLIRAYRQISENVFILLGGPEVSYESGQLLLEELSCADAIIFGEGESTFKEVLKALENNSGLDDIKGVTHRVAHGIVQNKAREPLSMDELPFVYESGFDHFENRILYYETMRGCPFNCQYCLSSVEKGVRFRSLDKVKKELQFFLDHEVMQVKLVDRTFNCNKRHATEIWQYIMAHDNGKTNFHFEISADLLDEETIAFLGQAREGLFQFEIGVQSTFETTIEAIQRKTDLNKLKANVLGLKAGQNIHLHLDLIAGLPYEDYRTFARSFNDVYRLKPEQLQLGFLKILKGSGLSEKSEVYGIKYRDYAPYEVLCTHVLSFQELQKLKMLEEMLELFYNSGQFEGSLLYLEQFFNTPFELYEALSSFWEERAYHKLNHSKVALITILKEFGQQLRDIDQYLMEELLKYDLCYKEKVKKFPEWMRFSEQYKEDVVEFYKDEGHIAAYLPQLKAYSPKQISRIAHIEIFNYNVTRFIKSGGVQIDKKEVALLFNYENKDKMRHNARVFEVTLK